MQHTLTLVDGTLAEGPARAGPGRRCPIRGRRSSKAKVRLHTQFDLERGVPIRIDVTEGIGRGEADERAVLAKALESGRCYVKDRGYAKFKLFNDIVAAESSYVCRLRDNSVYQTVEQRPLSDGRRRKRAWRSTGWCSWAKPQRRPKSGPIIRCAWSS